MQTCLRLVDISLRTFMMTSETYQRCNFMATLKHISHTVEDSLLLIHSILLQIIWHVLANHAKMFSQSFYDKVQNKNVCMLKFCSKYNYLVSNQ